MHLERFASGTPPRKSTYSSTSTPPLQALSRTLPGQRTAKGWLLLGKDVRSEFGGHSATNQLSTCSKVTVLHRFYSCASGLILTYHSYAFILSRNSDFLPQSKRMSIGLIENSKLAVGLNMDVCLSVCGLSKDC